MVRICQPKRYKMLMDKRTSVDPHTYSFKQFIDKKAIFVHIPKCAGVSVARSLFGNFGGTHTRISNYMLAFSHEEFSSFFKFTFVRDPWDRLASAYFFLKKGGMHDLDAQWAEENLKGHESFEQFVMAWLSPANAEKSLHFVPQYRFICKPGSQTPEVDFIGRFENIQQDFSLIADRMGVEASLAEENVTAVSVERYKDLYTEQMRDKVASVYQVDIKLFGYRF